MRAHDIDPLHGAAAASTGSHSLDAFDQSQILYALCLCLVKAKVKAKNGRPQTANLISCLVYAQAICHFAKPKVNANFPTIFPQYFLFYIFRTKLAENKQIENKRISVLSLSKILLLHPLLRGYCLHCLCSKLAQDLI